jgi:tRNA uridine 5-carboxymethylaminomethyl modification enzyme
MRSLEEWARFPGVDGTVLKALLFDEGEQPVPQDVLDEFVTDARYAPYLERQQEELRRILYDESRSLPDDLDYRGIPGLSSEMVERLGQARPMSIGAASRVRGVTPAALAAILVHVRRKAA